jgi:glycosyltransferase involved in cell wall biosynthesis
LTSAWGETFSVAALEAMAMGLPCVLTNIGGASEMVFNGFNGYLVQPRNPKSIMEGWVNAFRLTSNHNQKVISTFVQNNFDIEKCASMYQRIILNNLDDNFNEGRNYEQK